MAPVAFAVPAPGSAAGRVHAALITQPQSLQALSLFNTGGFDPNSRACHAAQIGGAGGITNARGLAGMYAPLANGGELGGVRLVDRDTLARMGRGLLRHPRGRHPAAAHALRARLHEVDRQPPPRRAATATARSSRRAAFGHGGAGGSLGFADPEAGLSFGYTMNRMGLGVLLNERGQSLVDAVYRCLGYALEPERLLDALAVRRR